MSDQMDLPDNMTEEDVLNIVRELCGDDMTDEELRTAYRSGMFQELCPDIEQYAQQRHGGGAKSDKVKNSQEQEAQNKIKSERSNEEKHPSYSKDREENKTEFHSNHVKATKHDADSESESVTSGRHSHHKKKKKKHSKDHKKRDKDKDERREKHHKSNEEKDKTKCKTEPSHNVINLSSDSENERRKEERLKKEKKKKKHVLSSSDSESDRDRRKQKQDQANNKSEEKTDKKDLKIKTEDSDVKPKVHPFYQDKNNDPGASQPTTSTSTKEHVEVKRERTPEKKKEPKPFSRYNGSASNINLNRWRPVLHKEHLRYQRKFRLKPVSVVCVDLLDFPMVFHPPRKHSKNPNAVPLASGINLSNTRLEMIRRLERDKANWFKKKLNHKAKKSLKMSKHKRYDSSDDDRKPKRARIMDRIINSSSDSNSDTSSIMVPSKKPRRDQDDHRDRSGGKLTKVQKEAEAKKRKIEELKKKVDKFSSKGTRVLPWENKDAYFKNSKKKDDPAKEKEKIIAEKRKRLEQLRKEKLEQLKNAPSVSFQRILKQIETANKEQACKPKVELKIPKKSQNFDRPVPISEYKLDGKIGVGDVYKEVTKLLSRNVLVECPAMAEAGDDLGEYTVKKIAWWILKNEKNPAIEGAFHPECHDDEDEESIRDDDFDWPSDVSSITGCVSDPEGVAAEIPPDPKKVADPDWADDYCGEASLYAKFRKETAETKDKQHPIDSLEPFKGFLRVKPGTNYSKPNFEVKCFVCTEVLKGQRQFGAHIRSESHKNNFRNYSLDMANYEENLSRPVPRKVFVAHLVEYSTDAGPGTSTTENSGVSTDTKHQIGKIEHARSDSPGPIVGGDAAPNIIVHHMPIPDDISLASMENYDISSDESLMNVRVALRTTGKWNDDLERRWRSWREEEPKIAEEYNIEREYFINEPVRHENYQEEWSKFWDKKCTELEEEGKDPENYNFEKEWMQVWMKRMQEIMQEKFERRVAEIKKSYSIDKHTLRRIYGISAIDTKRKKKKKKVGKQQEENSSSIKTFEKVESNGRDQHRQPMTSTMHHRNQNNVHSKPACLPTPPVTDDNNRERESSNNSNDSQPMPHRDKKSEPRSKHDKHHKHSNDRHRHRSRREKRRDDKYDKHDKKHRSEQDRISSRSPENKKSRSNSSNVKNITESVSSISSVEPPPPGEEPLLLGSSGKAGRRSPTINSEQLSKEPMKEFSQRIEDRLKEMARGNHSTDQKPGYISHNSKSSEKIDKSDDKNNESVKSKRVTSWSINSSDDEYGKKKSGRDSDKNSSTSSTTRDLQRRLQALRQELANDEANRSTHNNSSERPKVIPLEVEDKKKNLSDGEVASDISDFDIVAPTGVSTFVNKDIPGLPDLSKASPSTINLDKNSLGYHLLERKKSTDDRQTSSHTDRPKHEKRDDRYNKNHHHKDDRHGKSKGHSSRNDDRNKHKNDYRKDDRRRWDNSKNKRNHSKDHRDHRDDVRSGGGHDSRNPRDLNPKKNNQPPHIKTNPTPYNNSGPPPTPRPFYEDSWDTEDSSWDAKPQTPTPLIPPTPVIPPLVPENLCQIPVLDTATVSNPAYHPFNNQQNHENWNGGWEGNQAYDPNHYYNNY